MRSFIIKPVFSVNPVRNSNVLKRAGEFKTVDEKEISNGINGEIALPGDKSIAHRAVILSAITHARTVIDNFPFNQDCRWTLSAFKKLGIDIATNFKKKEVSISGKGLYGLTKPKAPVFIGDSGTSLRIISGVLAGQDFKVTLSAGKLLSKRPMLRVLHPLRMMGAGISSNAGALPCRGPIFIMGRHRGRPLPEEYAPITIRGGDLKSITYRMPVASAQVKSAILLAGLYAKGKTKVIERFRTRDHTEQMLRLFKADIKIRGSQISITGNKELKSPGKLLVPADISSAAFFIVLAAIIPNSHILLRKVSLNPTRTGIISVLKRMGADIKISRGPAKAGPDISSESEGDIEIKSSRLEGTVVEKEEIPLLIDELPVLMVAACFARGTSIFKSAEELQVKETDRMKSMTENLTRMGADIRVIRRGVCRDIIIHGQAGLKGGQLKSFSDHRTAMSLIIAGLAAKGNSRIDDIDCINKSFPDFIDIIKDIAR